MDNVEVIPSGERSESDGNDLRGDSIPRNHHCLTVDELHELRFTSLLQIGEIITKYDSFDRPKEENLVFIQHLTQRRDAWFVEAGDVGLIYLTEIIPDVDAKFHLLFWDGSLQADRLAACRTVLAEAFSRFSLSRVSADVAYPSIEMKRFLRDLGFVLEGVTRRGWSVEPPVDKIHFGILQEEMTWPALLMGGE